MISCYRLGLTAAEQHLVQAELSCSFGSSCPKPLWGRPNTLVIGFLETLQCNDEQSWVAPTNKCKPQNRGHVCVRRELQLATGKQCLFTTRFATSAWSSNRHNRAPASLYGAMSISGYRSPIGRIQRQRRGGDGPLRVAQRRHGGHGGPRHPLGGWKCAAPAGQRRPCPPLPGAIPLPGNLRAAARGVGKFRNFFDGKRAAAGPKTLTA
eukprot:COSAG04_NODE_7512_length_1116_cov_1.061947_1_plen_209_part_00